MVAKSAAQHTLTRLRQLRAEMTPKVSQEKIARLAGLSLQWYRLLENGRQGRTSWSTANALLAAFNTERQARGLESVTLEQLELTIV
jgi:DNA-binding XRE family transcriptional regulator